MKISRKWWQTAEIYKRFAKDSYYDFSEQSALDMFLYESRGIPIPDRGMFNGYFHGKKWMDLTITEYWLPDLEEGVTLFPYDLYSDFPKWFLDRILPEKFHIDL